MPSGACIDIALAQSRFTEIQKVIQVFFDDLDKDWDFHCRIVMDSDIPKPHYALET